MRMKEVLLNYVNSERDVPLKLNPLFSVLFLRYSTYRVEYTIET